MQDASDVEVFLWLLFIIGVAATLIIIGGNSDD